MKGPEIRYKFSEFCCFSPAPPDVEVATHVVTLGPINMTEDRLAIFLPRNMWSGPIRFRALVDVDEAAAAGEFGPHDRREADGLFHSVGGRYGLINSRGYAEALADLAEGDYRAIIFSSGVNPKDFDRIRDTSKERYWLLLQTVDSL